MTLEPMPHPRAPKVTVRAVIEVVFLRGAGVAGDPVREVVAYHDVDGSFLAEHDPCAKAQS